MNRWKALGAWLRARQPWVAVYPTRRLAGLTLAFALLWLLPGRAGMLVAAAAAVLLAAAALADYLRLPRRDRLAVEREAPSVAGLGDPETIRYVIRSSWGLPALLRITDELPPEIEMDRPRAELTLPAGAEVALELPAVGNARGRWTLGALALRVTTPLGLVQRIRRFDLPGDIVVVPSIANVRRFRLLAAQNRLSDAGVRALRQRGEGNAFGGMRGYVPGDDPRLVDWKATARHRQLIVREQTIERSQTVISMIDCGRAMTQLAGRYSRLEHVLSAALVLTDVAATSGDRAGLIAFDDTIRATVAPQRGASALRSLRTALSALDATMTEPDYAAAFRVLALRQPRRALVVLFTDVVDARTARLFVAHASRAAQRHVLVVAALQNEALHLAARPAASGSLALFRSAAAEELIREREEALARMRQAGVVVLDVAPGQMAAAVVNRYLEIKARGLL